MPWSIRILLGALLLAPGLARAGWQTAAAAEYSLLWKQLTYTELQVDPAQRPPPAMDILNPAYAKRIVIQYGVGVSAQRFREMTKASLDDAFGEQALAPHAADIERFCSWFKPVKKGDRYSLDWRPQRGLELSLNDQSLGQIGDPAAAAIILSVWLGKAAISESQRDQMLAQWRQHLQAGPSADPGR